MPYWTKVFRFYDLLIKHISVTYLSWACNGSCLISSKSFSVPPSLSPPTFNLLPSPIDSTYLHPLFIPAATTCLLAKHVFPSACNTSCSPYSCTLHSQDCCFAYQHLITVCSLDFIFWYHFFQENFFSKPTQTGFGIFVCFLSPIYISIIPLITKILHPVYLSVFLSVFPVLSKCLPLQVIDAYCWMDERA